MIGLHVQSEARGCTAALVVVVVCHVDLAGAVFKFVFHTGFPLIM